MANSDLWREYELGSRLEQELVRSRWTFFTAMLSVSFVVGGLSLAQSASLGPWLSRAGFAFGWIIFLAGYYHYWWFHRIAHSLRERLVQLEKELHEQQQQHVEWYQIRARRPRLVGRELYYHLGIDVLTVAYT